MNRDWQPTLFYTVHLRSKVDVKVDEFEESTKSKKVEVDEVEESKSKMNSVRTTS